MTIDESRKPAATTGTYVLTTVIASASAPVGSPSIASVRFSAESSARWLIAEA
ncbi:MAG: hypothetical protein IRZ32_08390 [Solirubrobacteraceae bacterium]|nr:hypothetical protein [Solirubrobacteraceae bacterium]